MIDKRILEDRAKYPDTAQIDLGEGVTVSLGDVREFYANEAKSREQLSGRNQFVEAEYTKVVNQYNELARQVEQMSQANQNGNGNQSTIVDELVARLTGGKNPTVFDKPGEYFKPVIDQLEALGKRIADLDAARTKDRDEIRKEINGAFGFQAAKDLKRDYRAYQWPKDWSYEKVMEFATKNRVLEPGTGYPDFDAIHERITGPDRIKAEREAADKQAEERGYERAQEEFRKNGGTYVPGPGFGGGGAPGGSNGKKYGGIDKVPDDVILNDKDVWSQTIN